MPEYKDIVLTSVIKNMDVAVFELAKRSRGHFQGRHYVGTLGKDAWTLLFHNFDDDGSRVEG